MRSSFISAAVLAFISVVSAANPTTDFDPMTVPSSKGDTVQAGSTYTIKWTAPAKYNGTISIKLLQGASVGTLSLADSFIDTGIDNTDNAYDWDVPSNIPIFAIYGIQLSWDTDPTIFQWSFPFTIVGSSAGGSSSTSGTSTKTIQISTNPSYTATSTSTKITSSASIKTNSTLSSVVSTTTPAGNGTLSTSGTLTAATTTGTSSRSSSSAPAAATSSGAAVANMVKGSFAVFGGAVLAFAL